MSQGLVWWYRALKSALKKPKALSQLFAYKPQPLTCKIIMSQKLNCCHSLVKCLFQYKSGATTWMSASLTVSSSHLPSLQMIVKELHLWDLILILEKPFKVDSTILLKHPLKLFSFTLIRLKLVFMATSMVPGFIILAS